MSILFFILIATSALIFFLSLEHQRWQKKSLPSYFRFIALAILIAGFVYGLRLFSLGTTLFSICVIFMLLLSLLPFLSLLKNQMPMSTNKKIGTQNGH